jgi:phospholipase/carboxylesterase
MRRSALLASVVMLSLPSCHWPAKPAPPWVERIVGPVQTEPGRRPPLLVLLHGLGASETNLLPLARLFDPRFEVVSLRAPRSYQGGHAWFRLDIHPDGTVVPDRAQARETLADLARWVEAAPVRLGTDPQRTFLLGFSQGAFMALGVLCTIPERLAGVVALSAPSPGGIFEPSKAIASVPVFVAHGTFDHLLPVEKHGRRARALFEPWVHDFTYREFPIAHEIRDQELDSVITWLSAHL